MNWYKKTQFEGAYSNRSRYQELLVQLGQLFPDIASKLENNQITIEEAKQQLQNMIVSFSGEKIVIANIKSDIQRGLAILSLMGMLSVPSGSEEAWIGSAEDKLLQSQLSSQRGVDFEDEVRFAANKFDLPSQKISQFVVKKIYSDKNVIVAHGPGKKHYYIQMPTQLISKGQILYLGIRPTNEKFRVILRGEVILHNYYFDLFVVNKQASEQEFMTQMNDKWPVPEVKKVFRKPLLVVNGKTYKIGDVVSINERGFIYRWKVSLVAGMIMLKKLDVVQW